MGVCMKKLIVFFFLSMQNLCGQFVQLQDSSDENRFLGPYRGVCATTDINKKNGYLKAYDCDNVSVSNFLKFNLLDTNLLGQQFYVFNNFMYWLGKNKNDDRRAKALKDPNKYFSGFGVFMIELGTSPYLYEMVRQVKKMSEKEFEKICPEGKTLVVAQLKYNNGTSIATWSLDSACYSPIEKFAISISSDKDTFGLEKATAEISGNYIDWLLDPLVVPVYDQASKSPRKIRFVEPKEYDFRFTEDVIKDNFKKEITRPTQEKFIKPTEKKFAKPIREGFKKAFKI